MLAIGPSEVALTLLFICVMTLSLIRKQVLAPWLFCTGVLLIGGLWLSAMLSLKCPYYTLFFVAVELVIAGGAGYVVLICQYLVSRNQTPSEGDTSQFPRAPKR